MRRILVYAVVLVLVGVLCPVPGAHAQAPRVEGEAALLVDLTTGQCLYEKNPDERMYPASTTKIMTALLALKHGSPRDMVTIGAAADGVEGSSIYLHEGERVSLEDLLWALLLHSGNDAAVAIAEHVGGSVEAFVVMMNEEARRLGATHTRFTNPHGLHSEAHYTTARDLSRITMAALQDPRFREFVCATEKTITRDHPDAQECLVNTNKLLWRYEGAKGVKTGYTTKAHQCLVAMAERDGRELLAVVLKNQHQSIWADCTTLLDYGFDNFVSVEAVSRGMPVGRIPVVAGAGELSVVTGRDFRWVFPVRDTDPVIHWETVMEREIKAPIGAGEPVGSMVVKYNGQDLGRIPLVAGNEVTVSPGGDRTGRPWYLWVGVVCGGMFSATFGIRYMVKFLRASGRGIR